MHTRHLAWSERYVGRTKRSHVMSTKYLALHLSRPRLSKGRERLAVHYLRLHHQRPVLRHGQAGVAGVAGRVRRSARRLELVVPQLEQAEAAGAVLAAHAGEELLCMRRDGEPGVSRVEQEA